MTETTWQPSLLHPDRVHARALGGAAHCGAELDPTPVRCALCSLIAHGQRPGGVTDIRAQLEAECAHDDDKAVPDRLLILASGELDTDPDTQYQAARALDHTHRLIIDAFVEGANAVRSLGAAPNSSRATRARAHLMETLIALDESLPGHDDAQRTLRVG